MIFREIFKKQPYLTVDPFRAIGKAQEYLKSRSFPEIQASAIVDQLIDITNDARYSPTQRAILKLLVSDMAPDNPWTQKFKHRLRSLRKEAANMIADFAPKQRAHFFWEILNGYDEAFIIHNTPVDFSLKTKTALRRFFDLTVLQFDDDRQTNGDKNHGLADQLYEISEGLANWGFYLISSGKVNTDEILHPHLSPAKRREISTAAFMDFDL